MTLLTIAKLLIVDVVLPPNGPLLLAIAGLMCLRRMPRLGRACAWIGVTLTLLLSLPITSIGLMRLVEDAPALVLKDAASAQAVVIPAAGIRRAATEYEGDTLNCLTLERVRYGAWVAERTGLPVLVTGGFAYDRSPEAVIMRDVLEREFKIPVRWVESASRSTHQNAIFSAKILHASNVRKIVLISHGVDMRRTRGEFENAGFEVIPAPTVLAQHGRFESNDLIPTVGALRSSSLALYELLGNLAYGLKMYPKN